MSSSTKLGGMGAPTGKGGTGSETFGNLNALFDPISNLDYIGDKLTKDTGIDELEKLQRQFDLETAKLRAERDALLAGVTGIEASKRARQAKTQQTVRAGRASTILGGV